MVEIILTEVLPASRLQGGKVKLKVTCFFFLSWDFKFNYLYVVCEFNKYLWATYSHLSSKISDLCGTRLPLEQPQELRSTFNPFFFLNFISWKAAARCATVWYSKKVRAGNLKCYSGLSYWSAKHCSAICSYDVFKADNDVNQCWIQ